jgi:hypothetical protein
MSFRLPDACDGLRRMNCTGRVCHRGRGGHKGSGTAPRSLKASPRGGGASSGTELQLRAYYYAASSKGQDGLSYLRTANEASSRSRGPGKCMSFRLTGRVRGFAADELVTGRVCHRARRGHTGSGTAPRSLKASPRGGGASSGTELQLRAYYYFAASSEGQGGSGYMYWPPLGLSCWPVIQSPSVTR